MKGLHALTGLLAITLAGWLIWSLTVPMMAAREGPPPGVAFDSIEGLDPLRVQKAFQSVAASVGTLNRSGNWWNTVSTWSGWIAFLLATIITSVAAFFGNSADPDQMTGEQALAFIRNNVKQHSWRVGLLAAAVAIFTAVTERSAKQAEQYYRCAEALLNESAQARIRFLDTDLPVAEKLSFLERLESKTQQACRSN